MAKLVTTKEKYGVSVAARIDPGMAHRISERAEKLGLSFAKMVSILIGRGFNPQQSIMVDNRDEIEQLEKAVADQQTLYKQTAAEFIGRISDSEEEQLQNATIYNEILTNQKELQS